MLTDMLYYICKLRQVSKHLFIYPIKKQQGRIHGNPVADGWAEAVIQKMLAIQKCYRRTDKLTRQGVVACRNRYHFIHNYIRICFNYALISTFYLNAIHAFSQHRSLDIIHSLSSTENAMQNSSSIIWHSNSNILPKQKNKTKCCCWNNT